MANKVLLAVYSIIVTQQGDVQMPSKFGGNLDLLKVFHDFTDTILKDPSRMKVSKEVTLALTGTDLVLPRLVEEDRELYGYFDAGRDGASYRVRDFDKKNKTATTVTRNMHTTRDAFYYLYVPKFKKRAYLILQRAQNQGIKKLVEYSLNEYLKSIGSPYRISLKNLLDRRVFAHMMEQGNFKEMTITKEGLPINIGDLNKEVDDKLMVKGTHKVSYQAVDLPDSWQTWAIALMRTKPKLNMTSGAPVAKVLLAGETHIVSEVSFRLELNHKQKTFHFVNFDSDQPDIDVSDSVDFDESKGMYNREQLVEQARGLVEDVNLESNGKEDGDEEPQEQPA